MGFLKKIGEKSAFCIIFIRISLKTVFDPYKKRNVCCNIVFMRMIPQHGNSVKYQLEIFPDKWYNSKNAAR